MKSSNKAFTLIELIFVIVIIGIISATIFGKVNMKVKITDTSEFEKESLEFAKEAKKFVEDARKEIVKSLDKEPTKNKKDTTEWN